MKPRVHSVGRQGEQPMTSLGVDDVAPERVASTRTPLIDLRLSSAVAKFAVRLQKIQFFQS